MEMLLLLITKPFSLISLVFSVGLRSVSLATLTWWHLVRAIVDFHVELCCKVLAWIVAFVSLPMRILTALQRERKLDMHMHNLETRLENVIWEKKELEERLHRAIKERKVIETVLKEIDVAHEKALSRIDRLESKLQDLKEENLRLNEVQGKASWDYKACNNEIGNVREGIPLGKHYRGPSWNTDYEGTGVTFQDVLMQRDSWGEMEKSKYQEHCPFKPQKLFRDSIVDEILERRRVVALSRSLFSSIMSLVVGMIIWEAEDPCMPLVAALFSVVGMSLNSVLRFFSTIKNKPAFDAVALLSVNWFILGTLTYPALPGVTRMLAPRVIALGDRFAMWLGFSS